MLRPTDPAFPCHPDGPAAQGLTVREHFACQILAGLAADAVHQERAESAAERAVALADALIVALNRR